MPPATDVATTAADEVVDDGERIPGAAPSSRRGPWRRRLSVLDSTGGVLGTVLLGVAAGVALLGPLAVGDRPFASVAAPLQSPSAAHLMGTDDLGRDVLTMIVHGLRTSLVIAIGVVTIAGILALCVGALAGSRPGWIDDVLMRATELVQVVPRFFLAIVVVALFGAQVSTVVVLLGLTSWTWTARVIRAETMSLRQRAFVEAARSFGAGHAYILRRHVAVSVLPTALVMLSGVASGAVLIEAGLGFVGLADPDVVSLGSLASNAQRFLRSAWWLTVFPGTALLVVILGVNLVGDALGDAGSARLGPVGLGSTR